MSQGRGDLVIFSSSSHLATLTRSVYCAISMRFSVISSGSRANCTYVEANGVRILIDCGLSGKQAEIRLRSIGVDPATLDAIIVTHEHSDHIHGVATMSRRFRIPVYVNRGALPFIGKTFGNEIFSTGTDFDVKGVNINPFSIAHDAADPVGFNIQSNGFKFIYLTDVGRITTLIQNVVAGANAIVLESNHDQDLLRDCDYPWELKQRIASTHGHLCNEAAGQLLNDMMHPELFHIVLGHLSENSNTPGMALTTVNRHLQQCCDRSTELRTLICGDIYQATPLLELDGSPLHAVA